MPTPKPSVPFISLPHILKHHAERTPDALAILAPGCTPLTYSRLYQHIDKVGNTLRRMGLGRHDRVAVVLPNGPDLAVAVLAVAANATCAPMNPAYGAEELDRYLADLRPRALITQVDSQARRVALSRGVQVVELSSIDAEAGLFTLTGEHGTLMSDRGSAPPRETVGSNDVALLMLTSGTTSRPKIVPLTHANICTSACSWGPTLALTETDRCLNMMPLFLGHGLIATVMASLAAGASVICTPGYDIKHFFAWLTTFRPTWYSAVPTIHQAILAEARRHRERAADHRLRFVRSGAARMPPHIFAELEQTFATSVIEFCGITETAASPVACNPLPPRPRKVGSIGVPVELDVVIMDDGGALLPSGQTGQVVVRGASVTSGYDGDPVATRDAFAGAWFKTGDQGFFDDDGYLFLVGRTKEIINRGGVKIAPTEVDAVLEEHPSVAEAATFAVPHPTLGEDVAAAIVLRPDAVVTAKDIRQFAMGRIATFKVPRQVVIVAEIPKGPTGKVQRVSLAAKLGLRTSTPLLPRDFVAPRTPLEKALAKSWAEMLQIEQIGVHDDFFASGGDSLLATHALCHIYEMTQIEFEVSRFFEAPTVTEVAQHLELMMQAAEKQRPSSAIVRVPRTDGVAPASFVQERLLKLQHALPDIPFFNILHALRVTSPYDVAILEQSINEIVRRHEILRTTFAVLNGQHVQVIAPHVLLPLGFHDLRTLSQFEKEKIGQQLILKEVTHSFDLAKGPLLRARLLRLTEHEHLLLISMHQVICDGWSLGVFIEELVALYDAFSAREESTLAPVSIQYADFAHWQRNWQSHSEVVRQLGYWREQLRDPLPTKRLANSSATGKLDDLLTARREVALPASLAEAAKRLSHEEGGTLFMALVAAFKMVLHGYLGQDDVRVASNLANRNRPGTESLIGRLVNTVILRTNLGGDPSPREVLRRVRDTTLEAFAHQDLPFEVLVQTLERERHLNPRALANIMISLRNVTLRPTASSGHRISFEEANPTMLVPLVTITSFDAILTLREYHDRLEGTCVYKPHVFRAETIDCLLRNFEEVLEHMIAQPDWPISAILVSSKERIVPFG